MANARLKRFHDENRIEVYPFEPLIGVAFGLAVDELEHECGVNLLICLVDCFEVE
jgi:hypothetical protein